MPKKTLKNKQEKGPNYYAYLVAFIDSGYIDKVKSELSRYPEYNEIEAVIPTVRVLQKTFKGKQHFKEVPLLFNYGFFKVPRKFALMANYLDQMQKDISCIYAWVKDPAKAWSKIALEEVDDEEGKKKIQYTDLDIDIATASPNEIAHLISHQFEYSDHTSDDLDKVTIGSVITLRGYPFEGIEAEILGIDEKRKEVKVKINIFDSKRDITVSFENVFFTVYHRSQHDENYSPEKSLDELQEKKTLDKVLFKNS